MSRRGYGTYLSLIYSVLVGASRGARFVRKKGSVYMKMLWTESLIHRDMHIHTHLHETTMEHANARTALCLVILILFERRISSGSVEAYKEANPTKTADTLNDLKKLGVHVADEAICICRHCVCEHRTKDGHQSLWKHGAWGSVVANLFGHDRECLDEVRNGAEKKHGHVRDEEYWRQA